MEREEQRPYAVMGITGKVGGAVARELLAAGAPVRAVLRDAGKADAWKQHGCEIAIAEIHDAAALTTAFRGAVGAFVVLPSSFDPAPGFPEVRAIVTAVRAALEAAQPDRVVCISTIGAQAREENLLSQLGIMEATLGDVSMPITFLRPAWFYENAVWDVAPARDGGSIPTFLQPLDKPVPMVATTDVGRVAAGLLRETWTGRRIVELEGPHRVTPHEIAATFSAILGRPVRADAVPRETWQAAFTAQGMANPVPRIRMLDGFNEGWIEFAGEGRSVKGTTELETVLRALVDAVA
jgi:uncharacterized protein YbjT (DUF2867 family)